MKIPEILIFAKIFQVSRDRLKGDPTQLVREQTSRVYNFLLNPPFFIRDRIKARFEKRGRSHDAWPNRRRVTLQKTPNRNPSHFMNYQSGSRVHAASFQLACIGIREGSDRKLEPSTGCGTSRPRNKNNMMHYVLRYTPVRGACTHKYATRWGARFLSLGE